MCTSIQLSRGVATGRQSRAGRSIGGPGAHVGISIAQVARARGITLASGKEQVLRRFEAVLTEPSCDG